MRILLISLTLCISFVTHGQQTIPAHLHDIDSLFRTVYKNDEPGVSIAILQNGKPVLKNSYGIADMETRQKITSSTNFNVGSLTKQFTAMAILQLAEKKKISLDDKLRKFFPEMKKSVADIVTV